MRPPQNASYILAFGHLCTDLNQGSLAALLPFLIAAHNYSYATAATLVLAANILGSVIQPVFGCLADKRSRPWLMILGTLIASGGMAATGLLSNFRALCAAVMLSGVGVAMFHPQAAQLVNRSADPAHKGADLGIFSFGGNLGFTLGPLMASSAISAFGLPGTAIFLAPALLFAATAGVAFHSPAPAAAPTEAPAEAPEAAPAAPAAPTAPQADNWNAFGRLSLLVVCRSIIYSGINTFLALYLVSRFGLSENSGTLCLSGYYAIAAVSALLGGRLSDSFGSRRTIRLSYMLLLPGLLIFANCPSLPLLLCLLLPMGMGISLCYSPMVLLGQQYLPNHVGFASGVTLGLVVSVGGIVSPLLGKIGDGFGLNAIFLTLCAIACVPLLLSFLLPEPKIKEV